MKRGFSSCTVLNLGKHLIKDGTSASRRRRPVGVPGKWFLALCFILAACGMSYGQTDTIPDPTQTGFPEHGVFQGSNVESVQVNNGNLHIQIPLVRMKGRGPAYFVNFVYDTKGWNIREFCHQASQLICTYAVKSGVATTQFGKLVHPFSNFAPAAAKSSPVTCGLNGSINETLDTFTVSDPEGGHHLLKPEQQPRFKTCGYPSSNVLYAADGSGWISNSSGVVSKDGTVYSNTSVTDSNGNQVVLNADGASVTDTMGRVIKLPFDTTDASGNRTTHVQYQDSNNILQDIQITYTTVPIQTNLCQYADNPLQCTEFSGSAIVPSTILLPNRLSYKFQYSLVPGYGEPASLTFPTGGQVNWTWGVLDVTGRRVATRTVVDDNSTWQYDYGTPFNAGYPTGPQYPYTKITDQLGNQVNHICTYLPTADFLGEPPKSCVITETDYISGGTTIKKELTEYPPCQGLGCSLAHLPSAETTIWTATNQYSRWEKDYDSLNTGSAANNVNTTFGNEIATRVFDFGVGAPGPLLQTTKSHYRHQDRADYRDAGILNRPVSVEVDDAAGVPQALTTSSYDDTSVLPTTNAPSHVASLLRGNLTTVSKWRNTDGALLQTINQYDDLGNLRSTKDPLNHTTTMAYDDSWYLPNCVPASVNTQAFITNTQNALGHNTTFTYYPCTGLRRSMLNQNDIDAGGAGTVYTYDLVGRPLTVDLPDGGHTGFDYHGDALPLQATTTVTATPNPSIVNTTIHDGMGRVTTTSLDSDPEGADMVGTTYDELGRQKTVSNPHRAAAALTDGITTYQYDALNRTVQVASPDGTAPTATSPCLANNICTQYVGNTTTVTDQTGKQRRSISDGLGRLIEVDEPGGDIAGSQASGGITISGTLKTIPGANSTPGTGWVAFSGSEQSKPGTPATPASVTVTIGGTNSINTTLICSGGRCRSINSQDTGGIQFTVTGGGTSVGPISTSYNGSSNTVSLATGLFNNFPANSVVTASNPNGSSSFTLTTAASGISANTSTISSSVTSACKPSATVSCSGPGWTIKPVSANFTGGTDPGPLVYDSGTCAVNINGTPYSTNFGQGDTSGTIMSRLAGLINGGTLASASPSGTTLLLRAMTNGVSTNYSLSSSCSYNSANFAIPSFTAGTSGVTLTGGTDGTPAAIDSGTVQMSVGGYSATANYGNGAGQDSTAPAVAVDLVAKIQAQLPAVNPQFTIKATGAAITIGWRTVGVAGNVALSTTSTTTQTANFSTPSFAGCPITTNPQTCSTALTGGAEPVPGSLSTPYVTIYSYDTLDNLLRVDQKGSATADSTQWRTRLFTYNSLSQLLTANNPESGTTTYSYDADGELLQKTSPAPNQPSTTTPPALQTISYCYEELHRVTGRAYSAQSCQGTRLPAGTAVVSYIYDVGANAKGHLSSMTDQAGSASYIYDIMGQLTSETRSISGISKSMSYTYNLAGSMNLLTYPSGAAVKYALSGAGRNLSAMDTGNSINYATGATYAPNGAITSFVSGNSGTFAGITNGFSYNKRLQPINMSSSSPSQTVFSIGYDFHLGANNNGDVFGIANYKDNTRNQSFTYDALNRLMSAQNVGADCTQLVLGNNQKFWGNTYSYDAWGNLLKKAPLPTSCAGEGLDVTVDLQNRLHARSVPDYQYDSAGNMTFNAIPPTQSYTYDPENRLTGAAGYAYTYDGDGNRVRKSNGTLAANGTLYWYMTPGVVAESDLAGTLKSEYVFFDGERVARRDGVNGAGGVFYYFSDYLKTASMITDSAGVIKAESDYYPWGGELQFVNNDSNHYKYDGHERDSETGLDYYGARYYGNALGRFLTPDWAAKATAVPYADFGNPQSLNLYAYTNNNPATFGDVDGHCPDGADVCFMPQLASNKAYMDGYHEGAKAGLITFAVVAPAGRILQIPGVGVLARNLLGLGLATAPTTVPIAMDIIEGATPGAPGFSVRAAAETLGMRTLEKVGESGAIGKLANGVELSAGFERAGSNLGVNISNIKAPTAGSVNFHGLEAGAQRLAQQQGATSLTIRAVSVLNPRLARILRKAGYTAEKVTDKFGRETVDYVKTVPVRQPS
jgi:RHS repeat-associated protein